MRDRKVFGKKQKERPLGEPGPGLFREILLAPDRDRESGAAPVVSVHNAEDPAFERELERRLVRRVKLRRRGRDHGTWAVLKPDGLAPPKVRPKRARALFAERHTAARPVVFRGLLEKGAKAVLHGGSGEALSKRGSLAPWLDKHLPTGFVRRAQEERRDDAERDIERYSIEAVEQASGGPVWVKTARLSNYPGDGSLRMRISFGDEGADDASRDEDRHRIVAELGRTLFPETRAIEGLEELREKLSAVLGGPFYFAQHIAYWNAPEGGALFHHDAFDEACEGGQRGVLYAQIDGATAWLALSLEDLALRVREFAEWLEDDELAPVRDELFQDGPKGSLTPTAFARLLDDWRGLREELAFPGCGLLAPLVNRGPEFTGFLADAGHAAVLEAGDAIYLPNHGLARTAMHSVYCASKRTGLGLSLALRREA